MHPRGLCSKQLPKTRGLLFIALYCLGAVTSHSVVYLLNENNYLKITALAGSEVLPIFGFLAQMCSLCDILLILRFMYFFVPSIAIKCIRKGTKRKKEVF